MNKPVILWADDEIDLLKPYLLFLNEKGYVTETATNGDDTLDILKSKKVDLVLLDENMPGLSGLETLSKIKGIFPNLPVVMITKSEEEHIMEDAIGSKISDYLIKPVNPNQILLTIKKNLDKLRLVSEKTTSGYQQDFRNIGMTLTERLDELQWKDIYKKIVYWDLELQKSNDSSMAEILDMQKAEANQQFCKFIEQNYLSWFKQGVQAPTLSHTLFKNKIAPTLASEEPIFMVLIDNLRYDQWKLIEPVLNNFFRVEQEELYFSILPTATQYSRNAIFAGLMPSEIEKKYPDIWLNDEDDGGKNMHEEELLSEQLKRLGRAVKFSYTKITNHAAGKKMVDNVANMMQNKLNVIVYNFVDMLSHARTDMEIIRELADDEKAYRSLTLSWFENSPLLEALKIIAEKKCTVFITTDHGTVHVKEPSKVIGDRNTNSNLRYKQGKSLDYIKKDVFEIRNPGDAYLPKLHVSSAYVFAKENKFFAYPNNYNHYVGYYKNTFQHGGISMEEMMIPIIKLGSR